MGGSVVNILALHVQMTQDIGTIVILYTSNVYVIKQATRTYCFGVLTEFSYGNLVILFSPTETEP